MFIIEDTIHCEYTMDSGYASFELALTEIRNRVAIPWDEEPNLAPCTSWRTCGRNYVIREYDDSTSPSTFIRTTPVVEIDAKGVRWEPDFADAQR